jgi:hypothetical protein
MATELQVISHGDPVLESVNPASVLVCSSTAFIFIHFYFYSKTPAEHLLSPSPTETRKVAKPPLVCGFVTLWQPKGQTESGREEGRERTGGRGASRDRTSNAVLAGPEGGRPRSNGATEPRLCSPWLGGPLSTHTKQRSRQFKKTETYPRRTRTCVLCPE